MRRYKFLELEEDNIVSGFNYGFIWEIGKWYKVRGKLEMCKNGFHCSPKPLDAFYYVHGDILAEVEVRGKSLKHFDKECWREMRITKAYKWQKKDSVALAIYSAELVLPNFEKEYPNDDRPRKAIEAAKKVLENDTKENREAARLAMWTAVGAARAARSTTWIAGLAAWTATSAAEAAAEAEITAAWTAAEAAKSAAEAAESVANKINKWMMNRIKELDLIKGK